MNNTPKAIREARKEMGELYDKEYIKSIKKMLK